MSLIDANFRVVSGPDASDYVVKAAGDIDLRTAARFQEALLDGLVFLPTRLIIDLSEVSGFDVAGVDVLVSCRLRGKDHGTEVVVQAPSPAVRDRLEQTGVRDLLPVLDGLDSTFAVHRARPFPSR